MAPSPYKRQNSVHVQLKKISPYLSAKTLQVYFMTPWEENELKSMWLNRLRSHSSYCVSVFSMSSIVTTNPMCTLLGACTLSRVLALLWVSIWSSFPELKSVTHLYCLFTSTSAYFILGIFRFSSLCLRLHGSCLFRCVPFSLWCITFLKIFPSPLYRRDQSSPVWIGDLIFKKTQTSYSSSILDFQIKRSNFHYKASVNNLLFQLFLFNLLVS